jgi:transposase
MVWSLARGEDFLPNFSLSELKRKMRAEKNAKSRLRLLMAVHRKDGKSLDKISDYCAVKRRTVHETLHRFQERGIIASTDAEKPGRPKRLTKNNLRDLRKRLLGSPKSSGFDQNFWNTRMVVSLVQKKYGVSYTPQWMWTLLKKIGFSCKKPRPTHYKSSPIIREAFKKKREDKFFAQNAKGEPSFVWMNQVSSSRRTLSERGSPPEKESPSKQIIRDKNSTRLE